MLSSRQSPGRQPAALGAVFDPVPAYLSAAGASVRTGPGAPAAAGIRHAALLDLPVGAPAQGTQGTASMMSTLALAGQR